MATMLCNVCEEMKPFEEFLSRKLVAECDHVAMCLLCAVDGLKSNQKCPYPGCDLSVHNAAGVVEKLKEKLVELFPGDDDEYDDDDDDDDDGHGDGHDDTPIAQAAAEEPDYGEIMQGGCIGIVLLTGEIYHLKYIHGQTILQLKQLLANELQAPPEKLRLTLKNMELKNDLPDGGAATLASYKVPPNGTLNLLIVMASMSNNINHVVIDFYWSYPRGLHWDKLDTNCLVFAREQYIGHLDFPLSSSEYAIFHAGEYNDDANRKTHFIVEARLRDIPKCISHLFLTLSSHEDQFVSSFPNPSVRIYEKSKPQVSLCETTTNPLYSSPTVILCYFVRNMINGWDIIRAGKVSAGRPIRGNKFLVQTLQSIVRGIY